MKKLFGKFFVVILVIFLLNCSISGSEIGTNFDNSWYASANENLLQNVNYTSSTQDVNKDGSNLTENLFFLFIFFSNLFPEPFILLFAGVCLIGLAGLGRQYTIRK